MRPAAAASMAVGVRLSRTRRRGAAMLVLQLVVFVAGCASTPPERAKAQAPDAAAAEKATDPSARAIDLIARADAARARGDVDKALYLYVDALETNPADASVLRNIAQIHELRGNLAVALKAYSDLLVANGPAADVLEAKGLVELRLGRIADARASLRHSLEIDPQRWRAVNALGIIDSRQGDHVAAIAHFDRALQLSPGNAELFNNRGNARLLAGAHEAAEADLRTAIAFGIEEAWVPLGRSQAARGDYEAAMKSLLTVLKESRAYNECGKAAMNRGDLVLARHYFEQARQTSPAYFPEAERNLAAVKLRLQAAEVRSQ